MMILIQAAVLAAAQPAVQEPAPVAEHRMAAHRGHHCCCCDEDGPNGDRAEHRHHRDGQG